eukprot:gene50476-61756_t
MTIGKPVQLSRHSASNNLTETPMKKRSFISLTACSIACAVLGFSASAMAQGEPFKVGLILPMTGPFASTGKQIEAAVKLYMAQNGSTVAGRKVEVILKDDAGVPDGTKRLAQELIVNDKVSVIAGFGLTPSALSASAIAT